MARQSVALTKVSELTKFPSEGPLVRSRDPVGALWALGGPGAGVLEGGGARVVVHEVARAVLREANLPAWRQGLL